MTDFNTIKKMIHQMSFILTKKQKYQMIGMFIVISIGACFELLGVTMLLPFVQSILAPDELLNNFFIRNAAEFFGITDSVDLITMVAIALIIVYLIKNLYLLFSAYLQAAYSANTQRNLAVTMLESYTYRPYSFFVANNSAELLTGVTKDITSVYNVIRDFFKFLSEIMVVIAIAIYLLNIDLIMAAGTIIVGGMCFLVIVMFLKKRITKMGAQSRVAESNTSKCALQTISGIKDVFVFNKRDFFRDKYNEAYKEKCHIATVSTFANAAPERIIEATCICGIILIIIFRLRSGVDPNSFVPKLAVFAMSAFRILPSIARVTGYTSVFMYSRASVEASYNNLKKAREYMSSLSKMSIEDEIVADKNFDEEIKVSKLDFTYENNERQILDKLSVEIKKGESVGLIGESGAGKSTLADILLALYKPQNGTVTMDGLDIFKIPNLWCKCVSYVPQTVFILDDTIRANVAFGEKMIDDDKVWDALDKANLSEYIKTLPDGLDTIVGERGIKFSGGQRQRIAIARALYNEPEILILDEATSALDNDTESAVMEAINALQGSITLVIIAHRLTTIANCDKVFEIKDGKAIERDVAEFAVVN